MRPRTRQQLQRCYVVISDYWQACGYAPTFGEIAAALGVSHNAAREYVQRLAALRFVHYQPRKLRTVTITPRVCGCGAEITPMNAKIRSYANRPRPYVMNVCRTCRARMKVRYYAANIEIERRRARRYWHRNKPQLEISA